MLSFLKYNIPHELDSPERTLFHRKIIKEKKFLRKLYLEWYKNFSDLKSQMPEGKMVEIGSGGGFLKEVEPEVLCSDVLDLPKNDLTFSALDMPFADKELASIFMIDTFHHIPDAKKFLSEASRVLVPGGMIIMIEPANSFWGRFIYKNFHHEPFDENGDWTIPEAGPLSGANGALPWIVFNRDCVFFKKNFPGLQLTNIKYHTPFRYLLSGGVSYKTLIPPFTFSFFSFTDKLFSSISSEISMFVTITIRKV